MQVFQALLRENKPDTKKPLIKEALDILLPALVNKMPRAEGGKAPAWIRTMQKALTEEFTSAANLAIFWHTMLRHAELFYTFRSSFVPQMINSLPKLGLNPVSEGHSDVFRLV